MSKTKQQVKKLFVITAMVFSADLFAQQSLQCQLEREQLVSEHRQNQQQRQALHDQAIQEAKLDPYERARVNLQSGMQGLAQVGAGVVVGKTLEQRIQEWERRCGR